MTFRDGLEALILASLRSEPLHGYAIARRIREQSGDVLRYGEGQIYPALHRLQDEGLVETRWEHQEGRPSRCVYSLTPEGAARLERHTEAWRRWTEAVGRALSGSPKEATNHG
ncbi:MAG: helix-turn-helix transcriptional regulator [Fimbriimonadales bacterium]